jgi:hypothetical protein
MRDRQNPRPDAFGTNRPPALRRPTGPPPVCGLGWIYRPGKRIRIFKILFASCLESRIKCYTSICGLSHPLVLMIDGQSSGSEPQRNGRRATERSRRRARFQGGAQAARSNGRTGRLKRWLNMARTVVAVDPRVDQDPTAGAGGFGCVLKPPGRYFFSSSPVMTSASQNDR